MVIVTGATGHIGNTLVRLLLEQGEEVSCIVMPGDNLSALNHLDAKIVHGNVNDLASLKNAFQGMSVVHHIAGTHTISTAQSKLLNRINVQGTLNVIEACKLCGVKRLLYVSSIHAIEEPDFLNPFKETTIFSRDKVHGNFAKSVAEATRHVLIASGKDLECVVVHPSGVIGPNDFQPSLMGKLVHDYLNNHLYAYVEGAYDFVDVRDVAMGILRAAEIGKPGDTFILSGEQMMVSSILSVLEDMTHIKAPRIKLPVWLAEFTAAFLEFFSLRQKQAHLLTHDSIHSLLSNSLTSHNKATRLLGYHPRSVQQSLKDTVDWVKSHSYVYGA